MAGTCSTAFAVLLVLLVVLIALLVFDMPVLPSVLQAKLDSTVVEPDSPTAAKKKLSAVSCPVEMVGPGGMAPKASAYTYGSAQPQTSSSPAVSGGSAVAPPPQASTVTPAPSPLDAVYKLSDVGQEYYAAAAKEAPHLAKPLETLMPQRARAAGSTLMSSSLFASEDDKAIDAEFAKHAVTPQDVMNAAARSGHFRQTSLTCRGTRTLGSTLMLRAAVHPPTPQPLGLEQHAWGDSSHRLDKMSEARPLADLASSRCYGV
jgi:hypothetical protein